MGGDAPLPGSSQQYHAELAQTDTPRTAPSAAPALAETVPPAAEQAAREQLIKVRQQSDRAVIQAGVQPPAPASAPASAPAPAPAPTPAQLAAQASAPAPAPAPTPAQLAAQAVAPSAAPAAAPSSAPTEPIIEKAVSNLRTTITESGNFDFAGEGGSDRAQINNNTAFQNLLDGFRGLLTIQSTEGPPKFLDEWGEELQAYLIAEVASYAGMRWRALGEKMDSKRVQDALWGAQHPEKTGHSGRNGVGTYAAWCAQKHPSEFAAWEQSKHQLAAQREQSQRQQQEAAAMQQQLTAAQKPLFADLQIELAKIPPDVAQFPGVASELVEIQNGIASAQSPEQLQAVATRIAGVAAFGVLMKKTYDQAAGFADKMRALPSDVVPPQAQTALDALSNNIKKAHGGNVSREGSESLGLLTAQIPGAENTYNQVATIASLAEDPDVKEQAGREAILAAYREGKAPYEKTKADLEVLQNAAQGDVAKADEEEKPMLDNWLDKLKGAEEGGLAHKLLAFAERLIVMLAGIGLLRNKVVGEWNLISNKRLAEVHNDAKAKVALKAEQEFRRFGLRRSLATALGGHKVSQVIEEYKKDPTGVTSDEAEQRRVAQLMNQLEKNGGKNDKRTVYEFLGNNETWATASKTRNFYKTNPVEAPVVAAATTPTAAPTTPTAAPAVSAPTSAPAVVAQSKPPTQPQATG